MWQSQILNTRIRMNLPFKLFKLTHKHTHTHEASCHAQPQPSALVSCFDVVCAPSPSPLLFTVPSSCLFLLLFFISLKCFLFIYKDSAASSSFILLNLQLVFMFYSCICFDVFPPLLSLLHSLHQHLCLFSFDAAFN